MKKLIALLLAVVMVLGLAACATKAETPATDISIFGSLIRGFW